MNFKKLISTALATGARFTPLAGMFTALTPSTRDDKALAAISGELAQIESIVLSVDAAAEVWKDKSLTGDDKAAAVGTQLAAVLANSFHAAGRDIDDQEKFRAACANLGRAYNDVLASLRQK